jgi:hypothetical protein
MIFLQSFWNWKRKFPNFQVPGPWSSAPFEVARIMTSYLSVLSIVLKLQIRKPQNMRIYVSASPSSRSFEWKTCCWSREYASQSPMRRSHTHLCFAETQGFRFPSGEKSEPLGRRGVAAAAACPGRNNIFVTATRGRPVTVTVPVVWPPSASHGARTP